VQNVSGAALLESQNGSRSQREHDKLKGEGVPYIESQGKRILFIHIPKTGGTSIEASMKLVGELSLCCLAIPPVMKVPPEHFTWSDCAALFPEEYFDYAFTIVRNPYERMESEYRMRVVLNRQGLWGATEKFSVWLANSISQARRDRHFLANHFRPQVEFLGSGVRVFRYEIGLDKIMAQVSDQSGIQISLIEEKLLSGVAYGQEITWGAQDIHLVNEFFRADFEALGYQKRAPGFSIVGT
jgi:Sulfotransferase family